jgi:hypothetical protein
MAYRYIIWTPQYSITRRISEAAMGGGARDRVRAGGGAQRPVGRGNESKKTGARSARARTRGQNPLVKYIYSVLFRLWFESM